MLERCKMRELRDQNGAHDEQGGLAQSCADG